ncbi:hypothetical protein ELI49_30430 (plasmid) [Rhizobium ruizarguesonis]|uniref:Uncharacterized protein n=1 Tax=Rhizobium ruizarguesonis TaxID=2081791 RepID=A0AAE8TRN9_9HYPH|nr:hypothetical protein [Rhizobium leguminosarum bv. viciae]TAT71365.1 hypothetical protein ELI56_33865 [Rhizobium ruizarguesonis]NKL31946.1 hypothetical protein [Rhizobium leguminosarum bv. viciae]NKL44977.1 hypothetical protein [Rhizobium leguminosarum bv. viciae]TAT74236.1 hypothetical protein ELI52_30990 [Rhizobium ruizarguesonis]
MHSRCGSRCTARASLGQTMIELVRTMIGVDPQRSWEGVGQTAGMTSRISLPNRSAGPMVKTEGSPSHFGKGRWNPN